MVKKFNRALIPPAPDLNLELRLWTAGVLHLAGIDEAGRGALAGPVCAAALILPADARMAEALCGVRDSKEMTPAQREWWSGRIREVALACGIGFASAGEIDELGIVAATCLAAQRAVDELGIPPRHLLIDYIYLRENSLPQTSLVKGDARSLSIAAASVLAKTGRDRLMCQLDRQYPGYRLAENKGYATAAHRAALESLGPSPIHRLTFKGKEVGEGELLLIEG